MLLLALCKYEGIIDNILEMLLELDLVNLLSFLSCKTYKISVTLLRFNSFDYYIKERVESLKELTLYTY